MPRILVLEDALLSRRILKKTLHSEGYEVIEASNGAEGLAVIATQDLDCILSDLVMPDMDGRDVLATLQQRAVKTPVIVVTADIQESTRQQCLKLGAFAVLHKIAEPQLLLETLRRAMNLKAEKPS